MALSPQQYLDLFKGYQNAPPPEQGGPGNLTQYVAQARPDLLTAFQETLASKPQGDYSMGPNGWQPTQHLSSGSFGSLVGGLAAPLAVAASPFLLGAATGTLGEGGLGAFTGTAAPTAAETAAGAGGAATAAPAAAGAAPVVSDVVGAGALPASGLGSLQGADLAAAIESAGAPAASIDLGLGAAGAGAGAVSNAGSAVTPSGATQGNSAISKILGGTATPADYLSVAGSALPGVLGALASGQQSSAQQDVANQYLSLSAPSRARFEASFAPGFSMTSDPGYQDALDQVTKAMLHKLSVTGNPAGSPNALQQILHDVNAQFAYPALQQYRQLNAGQGGIIPLTSAAPQFANAAIGSQGNVYNALGGAAADIFNPPSSLDKLMKQFARLGG